MSLYQNPVDSGKVSRVFPWLPNVVANLRQDSLKPEEQVGSAAIRFFGVYPVASNCPSPTVFAFCIAFRGSS